MSEGSRGYGGHHVPPGYSFPSSLTDTEVPTETVFPPRTIPTTDNLLFTQTMSGISCIQTHPQQLPHLWLQPPGTDIFNPAFLLQDDSYSSSLVDDVVTSGTPTIESVVYTYPICSAPLTSLTMAGSRDLRYDVAERLVHRVRREFSQRAPEAPLLQLQLQQPPPPPPPAPLPIPPLCSTSYLPTERGSSSSYRRTTPGMAMSMSHALSSSSSQLLPRTLPFAPGCYTTSVAGYGGGGSISSGVAIPAVFSPSQDNFPVGVAGSGHPIVVTSPITQLIPAAPPMVRLMQPLPPVPQLNPFQHLIHPPASHCERTPPLSGQLFRPAPMSYSSYPRLSSPPVPTHLFTATSPSSLTYPSIIAEWRQSQSQGQVAERGERDLNIPNPVGPRCTHAEKWKRLRGKRGQVYYECGECGVRWRVPMNLM